MPPLNALPLIAVLAMLTATASVAQTPPRDDWPRVAGLMPGSEIRVTLAGGRTLRGFLQSASPTSISINATTSQETLARSDVQRVEFKNPGHRGRNTLIGFAIGAGAGLGLGAGIDHGSKGGFLPDAGKIVFTPAGAIIGTVVGVAWPTGRWHQVFRVP